MCYRDNIPAQVIHSWPLNWVLFDDDICRLANYHKIRWCGILLLKSPNVIKLY